MGFGIRALRRSLARFARERWRLLSLLPRAGTGFSGLLAVLQLTRALIPAALAFTVGRLVAVLLDPAMTARTGATAVLVAVLFLVDQLVWLVIVPIRAYVSKRIDGDIRSRVRRLANGVSTLDLLESSEFQDRAARAVDAGVAGWDRERSAGNAAVGQLELTFRVLSAIVAATLLATFSIPLAAGLLVLALSMRAVARRQWMATIAKLDAETERQRYEYYVSEQAVYGAHKDVRLFGLADWFGGRFRAAAARAYGPAWRDMLAMARRQWRVLGLFLLGGTAVLTFPAVAVLRGDLDPGRLATYVLAGFAVMAISAMGMETYDIAYGIGAVAAAEELERAYGQPARKSLPATATAAPTVRFSDVEFSYPSSSSPVLSGLNLTLHPGQTVAIVGENGAGKTTLVKLLAGLYRPTAGRVTVDGVEPHEHRPPLAVLFQDYVRYPTTLRDNVTWAVPGADVDDDAVRAALRMAGGEGLPSDLDTLVWLVGTKGTDLSGGQWQRVALARVLYAVGAGRRLLVLDEPTASLDVRAEAEFHQRVVSQVHDATTILISHRLSTVRPADRIILLHDGRVAEDGTHEELLALGGRYALFFTTQAAAFSSTVERT